MELAGERLIEAPREKIWDALNDAEILKACISGCESIEKISDTSFRAAVAVKLGPFEARFTGNFLLSDLDPPNGYTISGEGQGGVAGSVKGSTKVTLSNAAGGTHLSYRLEASAEGKISQTGLADSAAREYAETFFTKLAAIVAPLLPVVGGSTVSVYHLAHEDHDHDPSNPHYFGLPLGVIIAGVVAVISVGITLTKFFLK